MANRLLFKLISFLSTTLRYVLSLLSFLFFSFSCTPTEPKFINEELQLHLEDVSCIEAWVTLNTGKIKLPAEIAIYKNNTQIKNILCYGDTLLYIDSLLPSQTYTIQALLKEQGGNQLSVTSNKITVTTMDTTSSNFTFTTWTFGGTAGSSSLYDVAIINENNIWAVGNIYVADTSENGYTMYNAVHWDGNEWELKRITVSFRGNLITPPLEGVFAFSSSDIWFVGSLPIHGDGENWVIYDLRTTVDPNISLSKAWGSSSDNIYFVGRNGNIAHYNGSPGAAGWTRIESGTGLPILDIFGAISNHNNEYEILCVAEEYTTGGKSKILRIENNFVREVNTDSLLTCCLWGIWFIPNRQYIAVGDGLWKTKLLNGSWIRNKDFPALFKTSVRGDNLNDIVVGGAFWLLAHWNGISWQTYFPMTSGSFTAVAMKGNIIIAVGGVDTKAALVIGRR